MNTGSFDLLSFMFSVCKFSSQNKFALGWDENLHLLPNFTDFIVTLHYHALSIIFIRFLFQRMNLVHSELGDTTSDQQNKLSQEEDREYKSKYRQLKKTLKNVVSKNEYLKSELRHSQKKLQVFLQQIF